MSNGNKKSKIKNQKYFGNFWFVFSILYLVFFISMPEVNAQRACTSDVNCDVANGFRCVSNRCNLPPPIWNVAGTGLRVTGQNAQLFLTGTNVDNSAQVGNLQIGMGNQLNNLLSGELAVNWSPAGAPRLGRGFTIYNGDDAPWFRVDADGIVSISRGLNIGIVPRNATDGELMVGGNITLATGNIELSRAGATVDGLNLDNALTGVTVTGGGLNVNRTGRSVALSLLSNCTNGQVLQWSGTAWACATVASGSGGTLTGGGAVGQLTFWTGASALGTDSGLVWNAAVNRLGIGVAVPASPLDVSGDVRFSGTLQAGSVPWARLNGFPQGCGTDQYVRAIGADRVICGTPVAGGGGGPETDPIYRTWYNNGDPTIPGIAGTNGTGLHVNGIFSTTTGADNIWIGDNNDTVQVQGSLAVGGCLGPVYRRPSAASRDGNRGGYLSANAECPAGMRVCGTAEILESINCGALALPGVDSNGGVPMWINNLAPSLPTPTNDCGGWRTNAGGSVGVVYSYNATGGVAGTAACNSSLRFACCQ